MLRRFLFLALVGGGVLTACGDARYEPVYPACRCEVEGCAANACSFDLRLHANCAGQMDKAEVLVDDHLESEVLVPGGKMVPCEKTDPGETSKVVVRGGQWIWGPLTKPCPAEGGTVHPLVFECREVAPPE